VIVRRLAVVIARMCLRFVEVPHACSVLLLAWRRKWRAEKR
jgi:hypothetical protein